ncbi:MAG: hypothetical protein L0H55_03825 [Candidatus Nitrosocosmicus sp.]|nr:hypothetical protein [Candidatus Nitrosocosmicus sp.]
MTAIDPTESQKAVADIPHDDRNYFNLFSSVNQLSSWKDTVKYSFTQGGKDGINFDDRKSYNDHIHF